MGRHVRVRDVGLVEEADNQLALRTLVTLASDGADLSMTWVRLRGRHRRLRTNHATRVYYVLDGSFAFQVEDDPPITVAKDEVLTLDRGAAYEFAGAGTYLVVNGPAFRDGDDEYLEPGDGQRT